MIDVNSLKAMLEKSNASNIYEVYVPSMKKNLNFKSMTAGMRKTLAKYALSDSKSNFSDFQLAKLSLIKTLCIDPINEKKITEIDFISLLSDIRRNNMLEDFKLNITCGECKKQFTYVLDFDKIMENCKNLGEIKEEFEIFDKKLNKKIRFCISDPYVIDLISLALYLEDIGAQGKDVDSEKLLIYPLVSIRHVFIEGEPVIGFEELDFAERLKVLEMFDDPIMYGPGSLTEAILEKFMVFEKINTVFDKVCCMSCGKELKGILSSDDFFTI